MRRARFFWLSLSRFAQPSTAALIAVVLATLAPIAHAQEIKIEYVIGSSSVVCPAALPGPVTCDNVNGPVFSIVDLGANSNSPGTTRLSEVTSGVIDLKNVSGRVELIRVGISANDFIEPTGTPVTFVSSIGGTVVTGGPSSGLTFGSCIDPTNSLTTQVFVCNSKPGAIVSGVSTPLIGSPGPFDDSKTSTILSLTKPFAIDESLLVTLPPGGQINFSASTRLTTVPEPGTLGMLGAGLISLAGVARRNLKL